jgi:hypothetical protein
LTDELLAEVARTTLPPMRALSKLFLELMAPNREELRAALMEDLQRDEASLGAYLEDPDAVDTLVWVVAFLRSLYTTIVTLLDPSQLTALTDEALDEHLEDPRLLLLPQGQIALMAALEALKENDPRERAVELVEVAFLNFMEFRDRLRREGFWLSPFPAETSEERRTGALKYGLRLRNTLTESDWKALDGARMGDLR